MNILHMPLNIWYHRWSAHHFNS